MLQCTPLAFLMHTSIRVLGLKTRPYGHFLTHSKPDWTGGSRLQAKMGRFIDWTNQTFSLSADDGKVFSVMPDDMATKIRPDNDILSPF